MNDRSTALHSIRLQKLGQIKTDSTDTEKFQNEVLRPILKFQNDIFLLIFKDYLSKYLKDFSNKKQDQKVAFVQHTFQKDQKFKTLNIGFVIGLMTLEELQIFQENKSEYNRRITNMITERIIDQVQFFG